MQHWFEYTRFFTALLVILDPFMAIPILLALTEGYTSGERNRIVRTTALTVATVLVLMALLGETMLHWLGTSLGSFRVGGGIVLFLMALAMLQAQADRMRTTPLEERSAANRASIAVVPLAVPLLAGPGAMSTVIIAMHRSSAPSHAFMIITVILLISLTLWLVLRLARPIGDMLGDIGLNVLNRLFGLILAAIAVEVIANGMKQLFPVLSG
ncbi:MAG: MarC family protein [Chromatiaceae bacterium]|jgi:multiple antibiotic resistance protein|nr:MarC family protein [Chromatiaceae bacterium]